ncbi:uncharacterized protein LOC124354207 [Homalodisca vitripennis]|uniref:uncharacterized protein LOC124354207 n=1 Tax=Homalodisca vitripennis TaxID=197043 RepID=UPI001EEBE425|nr:uncharacterized protein LOC124354207 [Homalodisca vitripennis]
MNTNTMTSYERMVQKNIEENRRVLRNLGFSLSADVPKLKEIKPKPPRKSYTLKSEVKQPEIQYRSSVRTRRSSVLISNGCEESNDSSYAVDEEENTPPKKKRKYTLEPSFGEIEGVNVGDWWMTRLECSAAGVHRPTVAGIHGKVGEGCYSIALSGGYEDDIDCGDCFTYTGSGGRDLKGTKSNPKNLRTAPQSKDQVLEGSNAALASNIESKRPVRVIRGYKLQSRYAPEEGYRYDGLYSVEKHWTAQGLSGFQVIKFALKRLPDQAPAPWKSSPEITSPEKDCSLQIPMEESTIPEMLNISLTNGFPAKEGCQTPPKTHPSSPRSSEKGKQGTPSPRSTRLKKEVSQNNVSIEKSINISDNKIKSTQKCEDSPTTSNGASLPEEARIPIEESAISEESSSVNNMDSLRPSDCNVTNIHYTSKISDKEQSSTFNIFNLKSIKDKPQKGTQKDNDSFCTNISPRSTNKNGVIKNNQTCTPQSKANICSKTSPNTLFNAKTIENCQQSLGKQLRSKSSPCSKSGSSKSPGVHECSQNNTVDFPSSNNVTPLKTKTAWLTDVKLNPQESYEKGIKLGVSPVNSSEKKEKFSPDVHNTDVQEPIVAISDLNYENGNVSYDEDFASNNTSDIRKQTSILEYFVPVKPVVENQSQKNTVNPKSLRGNRYSSYSMNLSVDQSKINGDSTSSEDSLYKSNESLKSNVSSVSRSSSQKRKYTSSYNIEASKNENRLNPKVSKLNKESKPTKMLETLMKINKKHRFQNQTVSQKFVSPTSVKPCAVKLWKLEESFLGWDYDNVDKFHGFREIQHNAVNEDATDSERGFAGWDSSIAHSSKGLVTVGFLIETLSNSES